MKILFISSWLPNKLESTNGNFVKRHAESVALLHEVEILHAIGDPSQKEKFIFDDQHINGIRTLVVYYRNSSNPALNFMRRMKAYFKGFRMMQKPDLVHANILQKSMMFAVFLKKKYQIPFVISEHWSGFLPVNRLKLSFGEKFLAKTIAKNAAFVLPVSHILMNSLKELSIGNQFEVVGNVINTQIFYPEKKEKSTFRFFHLSNLIPLKNPDSIINAALRLRKDSDNFELQIGGDGDYERLADLVKEKKAEDFIKVFGEISHQEAAQKMRESDCFVLFSDYESFSCVLLESLSSGVPVIATKVGAIPEIIKENHGIIINQSEDDLYEAMLAVLNGNYKADSSEELHRYVEENFSAKKIAGLFDHIYQKVVISS